MTGLERRSHTRKAPSAREGASGRPALISLAVLAALDVVGGNKFCKLRNAWCNCLAAGCFVRPDGALCADDNSPEACARRLRAMGKECE